MFKALLVVVTMFIIGCDTANATGNVTVETYTLAGVASIAHQGNSTHDHVAVNIPGFGNSADCAAAKQVIEDSAIDAERSMSSGNINSGLIRFTGLCVKVKQFVFAPNLF